MKQVSTENTGYENALFSCEVSRKKTTPLTTANIGVSSNQPHGEAMSSSDRENRYCQHSVTRCRSFKRCASHFSASEFSDEDTVSSSSVHIATANSILNSLSDDEEEGDKSSSSLRHHDSSKRLCHRRVRSTSSVSSAMSSNTTSSSSSLLYLANPIHSCESIRDDCDFNSKHDNCISTTLVNSEEFQPTPQRETQTLDWSDSIFQSEELTGQCTNKWSSLILFSDSEGIEMYPSAIDL